MRIVFSTLIGLSILLSFSDAQVKTNRLVLERDAKLHAEKESNNYARALTLAKQKGWSLTIHTRGGRVGSLVGVDDLGNPKYYIAYNDVASATTRANQLWPGGNSGLNLNGSATILKYKLGVWDGGKVLGTHVELIGRINQKDAPSSFADHATHVSGTMMASGVNPLAKGMAYGLQGLVAYDFNSDVSEMMQEAPNLLLSNHSYGIISGWNYNSDFSRWEFNGKPGDTEDYKFGYYSSDAQMLDSIAYNAPNYLIVKASGNNRSETGPAVGTTYWRPNASGVMTNAGARPNNISSNDSYGSIPWDANAKNILTVGAINGIPAGYNRKEDAVMTDFSSWGPTDDGRIKPDIVADGVNLFSSTAASNNSYDYYSGTSMATPNATGSLLLLQEHYNKLKGGSNFLRSASLKGLAIHTANEAGITPGPDYQFGWGVLNVEKAAEVISAAVGSNNAATSNHLLYENVLNNGQTFTTNVVASGKSPLIATISWTDPAGTVETTNMLNNTSPKLVNDLDIRITKGSSTYFPWALEPSLPFVGATKSDNKLDNVERVDADSAVPGQTYTIKITHKGALSRGSQAYSLLVSGVGGTAYCASAPTSNAGARLDSIAFKNINYNNPAGCTSYTDNTAKMADIEASQIIPFYIKTGSCDASTNPRIVTIYVDYNNNGSFEATEKVAQSAALASGAAYTGNITTPAGLTVGSMYLMRVIVQETSNPADVTPCSNALYVKGETEDFRLRVVNPSNDLSIEKLVSPISGGCTTDKQYITITIKNNGSVDQSNIPVSVLVKNGATTVLSIATNYNQTVPAMSSANFTFTTPFVPVAGTTYTISSTVNAANDQNASNNTNVSSILISNKPTSPTGTAAICSSNVLLKVSNPSLSTNYFWYDTPSATNPIATGSNTSTSTMTANSTYYLGQEAIASVGPANKMVFANGGYNAFAGNFINFNNSVPLVIETARLYIGYPGSIKFTVADFLGYSADGTSFTYRPISTKTIDVYSTRQVPVAGALTENVSTDTGAIYRLDLPVAPTGDHIILIECLNGATIFRNNGITTNPYPFAIPNIISITGNSAATTALPNQYQNYYYFFYDMRVNTGACTSDRTAILASTVATPTISQVVDSLVSTAQFGNQWYLNDTLISGATSQKYKPIRSGVYKSVVTDSQTGCIKTTNTINVVITALNDILLNEIRLNVSPNPSRGPVRVSFEMNVKKDMSLEIYNSSGQKLMGREYPGFIGKFNETLDLSEFSSDMYLLKIRHNNKTYMQKILMQK